MKHSDLLRHLFGEGCVEVREGKRHTVFLNPKTRGVSTVPRHNEINNLFGSQNLPRSWNKSAKKEIVIPSYFLAVSGLGENGLYGWNRLGEFNLGKFPERGERFKK